MTDSFYLNKQQFVIKSKHWTREFCQMLFVSDETRILPYGVLLFCASVRQEKLYLSQRFSPRCTQSRQSKQLLVINQPCCALFARRHLMWRIVSVCPCFISQTSVGTNLWSSKLQNGILQNLSGKCKAKVRRILIWILKEQYNAYFVLDSNWSKLYSHKMFVHGIKSGVH
jgi:hypothetical protein